MIGILCVCARMRASVHVCVEGGARTCVCVYAFWAVFFLHVFVWRPCQFHFCPMCARFSAHLIPLELPHLIKLWCLLLFVVYWMIFIDLAFVSDSEYILSATEVNSVSRQGRIYISRISGPRKNETGSHTEGSDRCHYRSEWNRSRRFR